MGWISYDGVWYEFCIMNCKDISLRKFNQYHMGTFIRSEINHSLAYHTSFKYIDDVESCPKSAFTEVTAQNALIWHEAKTSFGPL